MVTMAKRKATTAAAGSEVTGGGRTFTVIVSDDVKAFFDSAIVTGHGGFQSLGRLLKERLANTHLLRLNEQEFRRVVRCATHYGDGGFQGRLRKIVVQWV